MPFLITQRALRVPFLIAQRALKVPFFIVTMPFFVPGVNTTNICDRSGIFFSILGRGPRAFQIGKISAVNHYFGKFSKQTRTAFLVCLKTKLAITLTIAIKLKENRMQF